MDPVLYVSLVLGLAMVCTTIVCVVALFRAHRADVVALVRELPQLVAALLHRRRRP